MAVETGPQPGVMHPVDAAFYELAVKERDYERRRCDRLEAELATTREALERIRDAGPSWPLSWSVADQALTTNQTRQDEGT